jgi:hypothetical protein
LVGWLISLLVGWFLVFGFGCIFNVWSVDGQGRHCHWIIAIERCTFLKIESVDGQTSYIYNTIQILQIYSEMNVISLFIIIHK